MCGWMEAILRWGRMTEQVINKMDGKRVSRERGERIDEEGVWGVCVW